MPICVSCSDARAKFALLLDKVTDNHEVVVINRRGKDDVAMIAAAELASLVETAHLLRSPTNAQRLFAALQRARVNNGVQHTIDDLHADNGLPSVDAP